MIKKFLALTLTLLLANAPVVAWGQAALVPNAKQSFVDENGIPLAGGSVFMYVPNTTNLKTTWSDNTQVNPNTNPVLLDAAGRAIIFGQGNYRQILQDSLGNTVWDDFTSAYGSSEPIGSSGTDTAPVGSIMSFSGFSLPPNWQLAYGQSLTRADFIDLLTVITISDTSVSCTSGSPTLSGWDDTSQMRVGAPIEATCIPTGTTVVSILGPSSITVSNNATSTGAITGTVFPWGNGDGTLTFNVPDLRGYVPAGADAMGGTPAGVLTSTYFGADPSSPGVIGGNESHVLLSAELAGHTHPAGTYLGPSHNHSFSDNFSGNTGNDTHSHSYGNAGNTVTRQSGPSDTAGVSSGTTGGDTHDHSFSGSVSGNTGNSGNTAVTGASGSTGSDTAFTIVQPTKTVNYIIKVAPNSSGAGGVISVGGMFGDIVCDATFKCEPVSSVNTIGLATQADNTMLSNVSGGVAQPTPTTITEWFDATCGATPGNLLYRGASVWECLGVGTSIQVLGSDGTIPEWKTAGAGSVSSVGLALPVSVFSISGSPVTTVGTLSGAFIDQSANTVFAGPVSGGDATPAFRALVGADLPNPSASSLGGTQSVTCSASNWMNEISIGGVPSCAQPSVSDLSGAGALTKNDDTNVTLTLGGTPASALLSATSLTLGWSGTLAGARGGFGADVSVSSGVPLFAAGTPTFTGTNGSGDFARVGSPSFTTPSLGVATATSINDLAITDPGTGATLTIADGKTLTASASLTLAGTDAQTLTFQSTGTVVNRDSTDTLTNKTLTSAVASGTLDVSEAIAFSGDTTPAQLTANTNNYAPTGFSTNTVLRISSDAAYDITGIAGGADGINKWICNVGSFILTMKEQNASSTAANRFALGGDFAMSVDVCEQFFYDSTSSRWRRGSGVSAGVGSGTVTSATIAAGNGISVSGTCTITTSGTCTVSHNRTGELLWWTINDSCPTGSLPANGATVSRVTYAALWAVVSGNEQASPLCGQYGEGDGSTTFSLPNLETCTNHENAFIRAADGTTLTVGNDQQNQNLAHVHTETQYTLSSAFTNGSSSRPRNANTVDTGSSGGSEARPNTVAFLACIVN